MWSTNVRDIISWHTWWRRAGHFWHTSIMCWPSFLKQVRVRSTFSLFSFVFPHNFVWNILVSGLLETWYEQVEHAFVMHHLITKHLDDDKTGIQAFTFHDIQTAFYILGIGLVGCTIIFIIETFIMPPKEKRQRDKERKRMLRIIEARWSQINVYNSSSGLIVCLCLIVVLILSNYRLITGHPQ